MIWGNVMSRKKHSVVKTVVLIVVIAVLVFFLFPRKCHLKDGGTEIISSFPWGVGIVYSIENRHSLHNENGNTYYEIGTIVKIFGIEVYNDAHVDYDHPLSQLTDEEIERVYEAIESPSV